MNLDKIHTILDELEKEFIDMSSDHLRKKSIFGAFGDQDG